MKLPAVRVLVIAMLGAAISCLAATASQAGQKVRFLLELQHALEGNDTAWLADHMDYPLTVWGRQRAVIRTRRGFVATGLGFLGPKLRADVRAQKPEDLFSNWQGMMIGSGEHNIWVHEMSDPARTDYRIFAINGAN